MAGECARRARAVLAQQDWALAWIIVICGAGVVVCEFKEPVQRPVFVFDSTIANAHLPNTIDDFLAPLIPFIVFLISLAVVEGYLFRRGPVATAAAVLRFFLAAAAALMVVGFFTELFKLVCGRLRPDFLDRCKPALTFEQGLDAMGANREWGTSINPRCTNTDKRELRDGRVSFPSGHSSTAYVMAWFGAFYLLWGTCVRADMQFNKRMYIPGDGFARRFLREMVSAVLLVLALFQLGYAWGVGASRFRDNRHNASDVIAGFMLGITFAPLFLLRAIGQHEWWTTYYPNIEGVGNELFPHGPMHPAIAAPAGVGAVPNGAAKAGAAAAPTVA